MLTKDHEIRQARLRLTPEQNVEHYLWNESLRNLHINRRDFDLGGWVDRGEAQDDFESPGRKVGVIYPEDCKPTWPGLENPTSLDHAYFLRSRSRYIRDGFREALRKRRGLYLTQLEAIR